MLRYRNCCGKNPIQSACPTGKVNIFDYAPRKRIIDSRGRSGAARARRPACRAVPTTRASRREALDSEARRAVSATLLARLDSRRRFSLYLGAIFGRNPARSRMVMKKLMGAAGGRAQRRLRGARGQQGAAAGGGLRRGSRGARRGARRGGPDGAGKRVSPATRGKPATHARGRRSQGGPLRPLCCARPMLNGPARPAFESGKRISAFSIFFGPRELAPRGCRLGEDGVFICR